VKKCPPRRGIKSQNFLGFPSKPNFERERPSPTAKVEGNRGFLTNEGGLKRI